jgi:hypothetical protein
MSEREKLIEKLVTEMHLSVPERAALSSKGGVRLLRGRRSHHTRAE